MSYHHKNLFSVNYNIQSIAISDYPTVVSTNPTPTKNNDKTRKQHVSLILKNYGDFSTVVINLDLLAYQAEELEKIHKEQRYLVLSFNKIEEEDE